jgi:hypothetical protein
MTAVIVVTPRGIPGHLLITRVTSSNNEIADERPGDHPYRSCNSWDLVVAVVRFCLSGKLRPQFPASQSRRTGQGPAVLHRKKPLVIQVGSHVLYTQVHISGSEYIGPSAPKQVHRRFIAAVVRGSTAPTSSLLTTHCARWDSRTSRCSTSLTILARTGWTKAIQRPRETEV